MNIEEFKSRLTLPVIAAPMFLVSGVKLVTETCNAGVAGTFPALNGRTSKDFENMLKEIIHELHQFEKKTGEKPAPFGVNIIVNKSNPRVKSDLELCIKYKVPLVITSLGTVRDIVDAVHDYGGLVFHDVVKKRHAEKAAEAGVDGIIGVAAGAGGHAGSSSPFALISEIKSVFDGMVLLAGAINSGSDILAAESIGADLAYMGTRFMATQESLASTEYKQMLLQIGIDDIVYTDEVTGVPANFIAKTLEKTGANITKKKVKDFSRLNEGNGKAWKDIWSTGQGATAIHDLRKTADLIENLKCEYKAALKENAMKFDRF